MFLLANRKPVFPNPLVLCRPHESTTSPQLCKRTRPIRSRGCRPIRHIYSWFVLDSYMGVAMQKTGESPVFHQHTCPVTSII